jgi:hypothetical protein
MNNFPTLKESEFVKTREQFHVIAEIIGKCRETLVKPIAKNDNLWLSVTDGGFGTPPIEPYNDLEIGCNPEKLIIEVANNKNKYDAIVIAGKTYKEISEELAEVLKEYGVNENIDLSGFDSPSPIDITEINAADFHSQLVNYNGIIRNFHKGISTGVKTQVCLWPHHFDNSFKWFSGRKIDDADEQMGIGISNGDDVYALPYIYMTFFPSLRKTNTLEIAEGAILYDQEWTGLVLSYDEILDRNTIDKQQKLIEDFFETSFKSVARAFTKR